MDISKVFIVVLITLSSIRANAQSEVKSRGLLQQEFIFSIEDNGYAQVREFVKMEFQWNKDDLNEFLSNYSVDL
ncbi:MAG: hypothetical protein LBE37_14505 [Sphingobacterium sp.]|jgi:hypothetical protein|nr:hypothetical protein [Sphingobacterium sp.]